MTALRNDRSGCSAEHALASDRPNAKATEQARERAAAMEKAAALLAFRPA